MIVKVFKSLIVDGTVAVTFQETVSPILALKSPFTTLSTVGFSFVTLIFTPCMNWIVLRLN